MPQVGLQAMLRCLRGYQKLMWTKTNAMDSRIEYEQDLKILSHEVALRRPPSLDHLSHFQYPEQWTFCI